MNVLFISPGFPAEMPLFARGLASIGVRVIGLGDQPKEALPQDARRSVAEHIRVSNLWDEKAVVAEIEKRADRLRLDRIECLWEPGMLLAARLRETLGLPGMTVDETLPFRDKEVMKQRLDAAGIRTPRHRRATNAAEIRVAAEAIGFPLIVKPIAGAGSLDTYRVDSGSQLEEVLPKVSKIEELSVEEFIDGEEHTFDTICAGGKIEYFNVCWYRPRPLIDRTNEWISPQTIALRDVDVPELAGGVEMGHAVMRALGFTAGFTHMEWFRKPDGEVVFGEIAARPPGARTVDVMNYASDIDTYTGWAEAVCRGTFGQKVERKYNAAVIFKRARGQGRIRRISGLERLLAECGPDVCHVELAPVGARRRDWRRSLVGDGYVIVRHPDLARLLAIADRFGEELQLDAG
ncbi:MAG: ATP-grasp domain-containing protein [Acidobacteriota bacterium]|nr:ATP-grasp domain-containing protein [Acidobacteriota bacterium]